MPETRNLVDVEKLFVAYLENDAGLGPLVGGAGDSARVSTELPRGFAGEARVRLLRVGGTELDQIGHLDRALVQIEGYGPTKAAAFAVAAEALRAVKQAPGAEHAGAVVTLVERVSGPSWSPDPPTGHPRYLTTVAATVHPT